MATVFPNGSELFQQQILFMNGSKFLRSQCAGQSSPIHGGRNSQITGSADGS